MSRYRSIRNLVVVVGFLAAMAAVPVLAQAGEAANVTVVGNNYCLGCALKKEKGAAAQCSIYGHRHALKVEQVSGGGELKGATLHYLENDKSKDLFKGTSFHGKRIEVVGKLHVDERVIEVESVREAAAPKEGK